MTEINSRMIPSEAVEQVLEIFGQSAKAKLMDYLRRSHNVCVSALVPADQLRTGLQTVIGSGADLIMDMINVRVPN
jgi:hypothetical protein